MPHLIQTTKGQYRSQNLLQRADADLVRRGSVLRERPRGAPLSLVPRLPPLGTSAYCSPTATYRCKSHPRICSASPPRCAVGGPAEGDRFRESQVCGGGGAGRASDARLGPQYPCGGTVSLPDHRVEALGSPQSAAAAPTRRPPRPVSLGFSQIEPLYKSKTRACHY